MSRVFICESVRSMIESVVFIEKLGTSDDILAVMPVTEKDVNDISERIAVQIGSIRQHQAEQQVGMSPDEKPALAARKMEDDPDFKELFALQRQLDKLLTRAMHQLREMTSHGWMYRVGLN